METENYKEKKEKGNNRHPIFPEGDATSLEDNSIDGNFQYEVLSAIDLDFEGKRDKSLQPVRCNSIDDMFEALRNGIPVEIEEEILHLHDENFGSANCPDNPGEKGNIGIVLKNQDIGPIKNVFC